MRFDLRMTVAVWLFLVSRRLANREPRFSDQA
jgi:hypothetical protein